MLAALVSSKERPRFESQVLALALAQSYERGDFQGVKLAHKRIFDLLRDESKGQQAMMASGETNNEIKELEPKGPSHSQSGPFTELYSLLSVSHMSSNEAVHKSFLRKLRKVLTDINLAKKDDCNLLIAELQTLWISHDILTDTVTRADYDFRELGLRGSQNQVIHSAPEDKLQLQVSTRTPLRIGELLECAGLLEPSELEIACDMHRAMPEMRFGSFLVKQGFIAERDLESVLIGQSLIRMGALSIAQYQVAMELAHSRGIAISEILMDKGYTTSAKIEEAYNLVASPSPEAISSDFFKRSTDLKKTGNFDTAASEFNAQQKDTTTLEEKTNDDSQKDRQSLHRTADNVDV